MQQVLKNIPDDRLRAYIIWLPIFSGASRVEATKRSNEFTDKRLTYFWDGEALAGKLWQRLLERLAIAWDVYFLYSAEATWDNEPAVPDFWMTAPGGATPPPMRKAPSLDEAAFESKAKEMLNSIKQPAQDSSKSKTSSFGHGEQKAPRFKGNMIQFNTTEDAYGVLYSAR